MENTPQTLHLLKTAIETEDWLQIVKYAHKLKSSYGIVTISNSLSLIQDMEHSALEKKDLDRIRKDFRTVQEQYGIAEGEFDLFVKEHP